MSNDYDIGKKTTLIDILKLNTEDYSHVTSLDTLIFHINSLNEILKNNYDYFTNKNNKVIYEFKNFLSKSIICFLNNPEQTYNDFIYSVRSLKEVNVNIGFKMYDLLAKSMQENFEKDTENSQNLNHVQIAGLKAENLNDNRNVLKNYSNRLLINKHFEILRLILGDAIFNFFLSQTAMFIYEEKLQNYTQVTGPSLKSKLLVLLKATSMEKYVSAINSSSYYSQKNFMFVKSNTLRKEDDNKTIPNQTFNVERTKIYYCSNFNRKLGFFKNALRNLKKKESDVEFVYNRMFDNHTRLIPIYLKNQIKTFIEVMLKKINNFNYPKILIETCGFIKNWKEKKKEILNILKTNVQNELLNKDLESLLNSNVENKNVCKFVSRFLKEVVPLDLVGGDNFKIIQKKLENFVELNRFETFNKTSLFDLKEFSFKKMKWLEFQTMKKDTYEIFGIKLKNFIMKNIIFWVFDFLIVQLLRSHFYVTEKQGHNYKTFYYHKTVWDLIMKINEIKLSSQFEVIQGKENVEIAMKKLKKDDLIFGKVRLMPKPSSCRPIVSYKKRTLGTRSILKILLFEIQKVFKYISCKMQAKKDSCVVFDHKMIVKKLRDFKEILMKQTKNSNISEAEKAEMIESNKMIEELKYFAMDIEACYDNIDIQKLISILDNDEIISDNYVSNVLFVLLPKPHMLKKIRDQNLKNKKNHLEKDFNINSFRENSNYQFEDCFEVKKLFFISELNEYIHFLDFLQNKNDLNYSNCILYQDYQNMAYLRKETIIPKIKKILNNNIIKFNKKLFMQKKGIPQGLSVSSFLCNLYFYNIEKELSQRIYRNIDNQNKNLLMRFMDDYLCISNKENNIREFFAKSKKMAFDSKFNFNTKKSKTNVPNDSVNSENTNNIRENSFNPTNDLDNYNHQNCNYNAILYKTDSNTLLPVNLLKSYKNVNAPTNKLFNWNGINFELNKENFFNILIYSKEDFDIKKYYSSININLPIIQNKTPEFTWLFKKINSIFLTGHPWIYFVSSINDTDSMIRNMEDVCKVVAFKLIYLCSIMCKYHIQPGQNSFLEIIDSSLKKLYFYFSDKLLKCNNTKFFLDFEKFYNVFYGNIYRLYYSQGEFNDKLIDFCPFFFKVIRRKIFRLAHKIRKQSNQEEAQGIQVDI